jgi:hypothetical protein
MSKARQQTHAQPRELPVCIQSCNLSADHDNLIESIAPAAVRRLLFSLSPGPDLYA